MAWFEQKPKFSTLKMSPHEPSNVPDGLYWQCPNCSELIYRKEFDENYAVCLRCDYHSRLPADQRIQLLADEGSFTEQDAKLKPVDMLGFVDKKSYADRIESYAQKTGLNEAIITGAARIKSMPVILAVMDFRYLGGSMGSVVGEKITRAFERAMNDECPVITVASTGGARMQEAIISLMQMAKTSAACSRLHEKRIPFISILSDPSTAGVMASFAALGDLIISEPRCMVGFAGRRVIEQTVREHLPKGFQTAEFVKEHGFIDIVCHRNKMRETIGQALHFLWSQRAANIETPSIIPVSAVAE